MKPRSVTATPALVRADLLAVGAAADRDQHEVVGLRLRRRLLALEADLDACRRRLRADTVFVFSITLSKRGAFIFSHTLTRSRSAPAIMMSSISTTSMRVPSVEYTVAISRPMMPPPTTSMRFGIALQLERAGRIDDARIVGHERQLHRLAAGGDDRLLELDDLLLAGLVLAGAGRELDLEVMRVEEAADAAHDLDLARLRHAGEAAGQLLDDAFLEAAQLVEVDLRRAVARCRARRAPSLRPSTAAVCSSAFDGMQPTLRHTPPSVA